MKHVATALTKAKKATGYSYRQVYIGVVERLGVYAPSQPVIQNYHSAEHIPAKVDLMILGAIVDVYGQTISDVAPELTGVLDQARDMLIRSFAWMSRELAAA